MSKGQSPCECTEARSAASQEKKRRQSPCECTEARSAASQEKRKGKALANARKRGALLRKKRREGKALAKGRFFMDINSISSYYQDIYGNASNQISDQLKNKLQADYSKATDDELMNVCKQFESYFMEQMLKEMVKTIPVNEERTGANATMTDYYKDMMIQNVASQSTEQNSLGLAQTLYEQMRRNYGLDEPNLPSK